ncbi:hypothetical protein BKA03_000460 [Demequina lutea]|uniref:Uncharacterized protein n=1 Tax=Demequina lutea TaxID=431489 RepID=A0A7Y9Z829_9MICO|nr:hypothetical protein [Demequina lutea]
MPVAEECDPDGSGVPECRTGLAGRAQFVVSELRDLWRELHEHREPQSGHATAPLADPASGEQSSV